MKKAVFLDTNVLLDVILERSQFLNDSKKILTLGDEGKVELYASALTIANCAYFARKFGGNPHKCVELLLTWVKVIDLTRNHFEQVLTSSFTDFEDGLQFFSAREIKAIDVILTRNVNHFKSSDIPILTPSEFLQTLSPS